MLPHQLHQLVSVQPLRIQVQGILYRASHVTRGWRVFSHTHTHCSPPIPRSISFRYLIDEPDGGKYPPEYVVSRTAPFHRASIAPAAARVSAVRSGMSIELSKTAPVIAVCRSTSTRRPRSSGETTRKGRLSCPQTVPFFSQKMHCLSSAGSSTRPTRSRHASTPPTVQTGAGGCTWTMLMC